MLESWAQFIQTISHVVSWHWWILGVILLIIEVTAPGMFFIWLALAAFVTGLLVFIFPIPFILQIMIFAILSLFAAWISKRLLDNMPVHPDAEQLNSGAQRLLGRTVKVTSEIYNGQGRVRVGDSDWRALGPDAPEGSDVIIVDTDGNTLIVKLT